MNGWSMSHEFKELKRELPSLAPEDVDCYFTAFIEGEQGLSEGELRRSEHLLEKMRDEAPGNPGANACIRAAADGNGGGAIALT